MKKTTRWIEPWKWAPLILELHTPICSDPSSSSQPDPTRHRCLHCWHGCETLREQNPRNPTSTCVCKRAEAQPSNRRNVRIAQTLRILLLFQHFWSPNSKSYGVHKWLAKCLFPLCACGERLCRFVTARSGNELRIAYIHFCNYELEYECANVMMMGWCSKCDNIWVRLTSCICASSTSAVLFSVTPLFCSNDTPVSSQKKRKEEKTETKTSWRGTCYYIYDIFCCVVDMDNIHSWPFCQL